MRAIPRLKSFELKEYNEDGPGSSSGSNGNTNNNYATSQVVEMGLGHINRAFFNDETTRGSFYGTTQSTAEEHEKKSVTNGGLTSGVPQGPEPTPRDTWDNPIEFLLSCISMSVGLGNVWRFPFVAYENGGGAFLIPYLVVLYFIGKPMYFLEMALGQFSSYGQVKIWTSVPFFKGVGYGSMIGTCCVVSYYVALMALTSYYFFSSFQRILPWSMCDPSWADEGTCIRVNGTDAYQSTLHVSVAQQFFEKEAFPQIPNLDNGIGSPQWRLTLCLLFSWIMIFLSLVKGVRSSGKVAYFTAIFPYVVLFILLIRGVTLPGAWNGILYFIEPQWKKIYDPNVWFAAVGQCFFSLSTGFGPIIMFASYNPFDRNVYKDALIISFMDTFTSLLAGCTIFAILGSLAENLGVKVTDVVRSGPGLAFVSYPDAISQMPVSQLFAVLFFLMLFTLGIGSATSLTGGIITIFCDQFPNVSRWKITVFICGGLFSAGLMYVTPGGQFMLTLVDRFGANFVIYVMAIFEMIGICWVYGLNNVCEDIEFMLNIKITMYWKFCWAFVIPVGLSLILVYTFVNYEELTYNDVTFPDSYITCGWLLAVFALSSVPIWAVHSIYSRKATTLKGKIIESFQPTKDWGPKSQKTRQEWLEYKRELRGFADCV